MNNIESIRAYFSSELVLFLGLVFVLFVAMKKQNREAYTAGLVTTFVLFFSFVAIVFTHFQESLSLFHGMISLDPFGQFFKIIIIGTAMLTVLMASKSRDLDEAPHPEFYVFLLALTLGLNILVVASHLIMIYLAIEMSSLMSYVLAAFISKESKRSQEAGLKYVMYGGVASGIMIFGMSLLYGLTGTLSLSEIRMALNTGSCDVLILFLSVVMILGGLGYKMAVVPFHMWSPDVYEGAPFPVTAFLSVASKAGGFAVAMRFFFMGFTDITGQDLWVALGRIDWPFLLAVLSALSMTVGNVIALHQKNIKRFLAYSSIAHAGYVLMAVASVSRVGVEAVLFYFVIYFFMNLGAFLVATIIANQFQTEDMCDYKGLVKQNSFGAFLAITLTVFLFSLSGIPPFAGFVAKWYVLKAAVDANLYWLAVVAVINSVIALVYYVRLIKFMMFDDKEKELPVTNTNWRYAFIILLFAAMTVFFGLYFQPIAEWAKASAHFLY